MGDAATSSPGPAKRSRIVPVLLIVSMVAAIFLWFFMLAITRPPAPPEGDVRAALSGVVSAVKVGHYLPGTAAYGPGEVIAGSVLASELAWEHVGGVLIFRLPSPQILSVHPEMNGEALLKIRQAALNGGILTHCEDALSQEISTRIGLLGYEAEVHFSRD